MYTRRPRALKIFAAMLVLTACSFGSLSFADPVDDVVLPALDGEKLANADRSLWRLPNISPPKGEVLNNTFYYGLRIGGHLFFSTVHQGGEAGIGSRAGGHFKILREAYRISALLEGRSPEQAEMVAQKAQRLQAQHNLKLEGVRAFGFKVVETKTDGRAIKWHGFNSFKSTIHGNEISAQEEVEINNLDVVLAVTEKLRFPSVIADPINDPDLLLNPKYLDKTQPRYYRTRTELWNRTRQIRSWAEYANDKLGFDNFDTNQGVEIPEYGREEGAAPKRLGYCAWLLGFFGAERDGL